MRGLLLDDDSSPSPADRVAAGAAGQADQPDPVRLVLGRLVVVDVVGLVVCPVVVASLPGHHGLVQGRLEVRVEPTVDEKVEDAVHDDEQMSVVSGADEPDWGEVVQAAFEDLVDGEQLVKVDQQAGHICHHEHADDEDQNVSELEVLGLKKYTRLLLKLLNGSHIMKDIFPRDNTLKKCHIHFTEVSLIMYYQVLEETIPLRQRVTKYHRL